MSDLMIRDARADEHDDIRELTVAAYTEYVAAMGDHWDDYRAGLLNRLNGSSVLHFTNTSGVAPAD